MQSAVQPTCGACGGVLQALGRCASCGSASQVKDYRVERTLAQHPHARVYAGRRLDGTAVALKEVLFSVVPSMQQLDAFYREAAVLQALHLRRTPHFIEAFSLGEGVDTRLYLVQEFIEGESLLARLEREPLRAAAFDDVATQVLETLIALHSRTPRLIHRDIKPENLVFRTSGELVLVDFGSARQLEQAVTYGSTMVGTVGYMPPEQLGGTIDETSDLHALGATLLHAASQQAPAAFLRDGLHLVFGKVAGLSSQQNEFLGRLTAPKRADRFSTAEEALRWLRAPHRPPRRTLVLVAAALGVMALIGSTVVHGLTASKVSVPPAVSASPGESTAAALLD